MSLKKLRKQIKGKRIPPVTTEILTESLSDLIQEGFMGYLEKLKTRGVTSLPPEAMRAMFLYQLISETTGTPGPLPWWVSVGPPPEEPISIHPAMLEAVATVPASKGSSHQVVIHQEEIESLAITIRNRAGG